MESYMHILAAIDFSSSSTWVLQKARRESRLHAARLTLVHVVEFYPEDAPPGLVPPENSNPIEVYLERARENLDRLAVETGTSDSNRIALSYTGAAYHEIVRVARESAADLIVMGYVGRWVMDTLGSTAMAVTRHARCDVLLVRNQESGT